MLANAMTGIAVAWSDSQAGPVMPMWPRSWLMMPVGEKNQFHTTPMATGVARKGSTQMTRISALPFRLLFSSSASPSASTVWTGMFSST